MDWDGLVTFFWSAVGESQRMILMNYSHLPFFFFLLRPWLPFNIHNTCQEKKRLYHGFLSKKIKNYYPGEKFGIIN